jgi:hypothetical protein
LLESNPLTPIDIRILVALTRSKNGSLHAEEILEETGIAMSTWSSKQGKLVSMGLLEKHFTRVMGDEHVMKRMNYALTKKGKIVGQSLLQVTTILKDSPRPSLVTSPVFAEEGSLGQKDQLPSTDFQEMIGECVEVALDSFGSRLIDLVKKSLEVEHGVSWNSLPEKTQDFESVLRDYFGLEAAIGLKKLIGANITSRFDLKELENEDLSSLILRARTKVAGGKLSGKPFQRSEGIP